MGLFNICIIKTNWLKNYIHLTGPSCGSKRTVVKRLAILFKLSTKETFHCAITICSQNFYAVKKTFGMLNVFYFVTFFVYFRILLIKVHALSSSFYIPYYLSDFKHNCNVLSRFCSFKP